MDPFLLHSHNIHIWYILFFYHICNTISFHNSLGEENVYKMPGVLLRLFPRESKIHLASFLMSEWLYWTWNIPPWRPRERQLLEKGVI